MGIDLWPKYTRLAVILPLLESRIKPLSQIFIQFTPLIKIFYLLWRRDTSSIGHHHKITKPLSICCLCTFSWDMCMLLPKILLYVLLKRKDKELLCSLLTTESEYPNKKKGKYLGIEPRKIEQPLYSWLPFFQLIIRFSHPL